jgi:hypothetical protein
MFVVRHPIASDGTDPGANSMQVLVVDHRTLTPRLKCLEFKRLRWSPRVIEREEVSVLNESCTTVARTATVVHEEEASLERLVDQVRSITASFDAALSLPALVVAFTVT